MNLTDHFKARHIPAWLRRSLMTAAEWSATSRIPYSPFVAVKEIAA